MAINFLNTVDLNQNQLDHARIVNEAGNVAAGTGVAGQLYFDTTADAGVGVLKVWTDQWVEVGGGVESLTNTSGTYVAFGTDNVSATGAVTLGTVDLTAVDGTSVLATRFLSKDNTWDVPAFDNYSGWILDGDSGIAQTISSGNTALFTGGTKITTSVAATDVLTITHDAQAQTDTTSAVTANAFTVVNSVGVDSTGHVTGVDIKTVTVPDNNTTYDLTTAPTGTAVRLTDSASVNDDVTISGTTGRTAMSRINASELRVDLTDSVIIVDDLTVGGIITQSQTGETNSFASQLDMNSTKLLNVATGSADTDGVNWGQVRDAIAGIGLFQGGYNATTGLTVNLSSNGSLDGASNIELDKGDYFVVTTAGTAFYGVTLEVGDMIFANVDIAANSNPAQSVYTTVIQDANIAGAGSTDGATQKGVAGFDSANFDVTASGWVQLNSQRNPYGAKQSLNNTAPSSRAESGGVTTFTIDLAAASLFGTGALSENVKVEVTEGAAPYETVYACVTRSGSASLAVGFTGSIANDAYQVLLSHV